LSGSTVIRMIDVRVKKQHLRIATDNDVRFLPSDFRRHLLAVGQIHFQVSIWMVKEVNLSDSYDSPSFSLFFLANLF
jgi:hypothetical protein